MTEGVRTGESGGKVFKGVDSLSRPLIAASGARTSLDRRVFRCAGPFQSFRLHLPNPPLRFEASQSLIERDSRPGRP